MRKKWYIVFISLLIIGIGLGIAYVEFWRDAGVKLPTDVEMTTAYGEAYDLTEMDEKVRIVEFMYTKCPDVCPLTTQRMMHLKDQFQKAGVYGDKVEFLSITIDPENDTEKVLQNYMKVYETENDENWTFLRGSVEDTKKLADPFRFLFKDNGTDYLVHTSYTYLIDEDNYLVAKYPMGEGFEKDRVYNDVMKLVN
ncbi:SCO family protein [Pontibacillus litoralis]|uniref:Electron transporter SenC n=1 Tax=Pontibacillus litoralis JSM 072002 TaxID=1385512 RepID=A0A0A5G144_9BACI|nr:SCO family protein [Pontibacillus litoralis]KGX84795.1 electron transporter SenC [Pontibacillus litoralis JSM 072002]